MQSKLCQWGAMDERRRQRRHEGLGCVRCAVHPVSQLRPGSDQAIQRRLATPRGTPGARGGTTGAGPAGADPTSADPAASYPAGRAGCSGGTRPTTALGGIAPSSPARPDRRSLPAAARATASVAANRCTTATAARRMGRSRHADRTAPDRHAPASGPLVDTGRTAELPADTASARRIAAPNPHARPPDRQGSGPGGIGNGGTYTAATRQAGASFGGSRAAGA